MSTAELTPDFTHDDLQHLQATVERFAKQAIAPQVPTWEEAGQFDRSLYTQAAELGLLGLGYPAHLGGTPAPWRGRNLLSQTLARHGGSGGVMASLFSHNIGLPPVMAHGSAELQAEVVPPVLRGERIAAASVALAQFFFVLAPGVLGVVACRSLKLPPMLGYLVVGVAIGPSVIGLGQGEHDEGLRYLGEFGVVLMIGGNIPQQTRVVSTQIYGHVEALEYAQAHWLSAGMVAFSFVVLLSLSLLSRRGSRVLP